MKGQLIPIPSRTTQSSIGFGFAFGWFVEGLFVIVFGARRMRLTGERVQIIYQTRNTWFDHNYKHLEES